MHNMQGSDRSGCPHFAKVAATSTSEYDNLYHSFVSDDSDNLTTSIPEEVHTKSQSADANDFIVVGGTDMLLHSATTNTNVIIPFRKAGVTGFVELTSISHMVPALCYMASSGRTTSADRIKFEANINMLLTNDQKFDWLYSDAAPKVIKERAKKMESLITFALTGVSSFLKDNPDGFELSKVKEQFDLLDNSSVLGYWRSVMVGTFELIVLMTIDNLQNGEQAQYLKDINWDTVEVLFSGQTGASSAGLNRSTNSTYKYMKGLSAYLDTNGQGFRLDKTYFAPYAAISEWSTQQAQIDLDFIQFKNVCNNLNDRVEISSEMFSNFKDIDGNNLPTAISNMYSNRLDANLTMEKKIPIDTSNEPMSTMASLMHRMAWTMIDYRDTLSDCVTERVLEIWKNADYDTSKTQVDGVDTVEYPV